MGITLVPKFLNFPFHLCKHFPYHAETTAHHVPSLDHTLFSAICSSSSLATQLRSGECRQINLQRPMVNPDQHQLSAFFRFHWEPSRHKYR